MDVKRLVAVLVFVFLIVVLAGSLLLGRSQAQVLGPAIEDLTPPELVDLAISPSLIDTDFTDVTITATVRMTDDLSGVQHVWVAVAPIRDMPPGSCDQYYGGWASLDPSLREATVDVPITLLQYSKEGEWGIWYITVRDRIGNDVTYYNPLDGTVDSLGNPQDPYCRRHDGVVCLPDAFDKRFVNYPGTPLATPTPSETMEPTPSVTVAPTPLPLCTPPPCPPEGRLVCLAPDGCPGGCGYTCIFTTRLPNLSK